MIASGHRLAPFIGAEWPGIPGSLYAGVAVAEPADGYPDDAHLVVLPGSMTQCRNYHGCIEWAAQQGVDAHAPTHREGALITATLRGRLDMSVSWWFWTA
ncbi:MAG: hypothetical protein AzoDbin1_05355, partial [Azoarcus sp.]|nr:hypothetical protein [Azoarcus sp.]